MKDCHDVSRRHVAAVSGVSANRLKSIEAGRQPLAVPEYAALLAAFGLRLVIQGDDMEPVRVASYEELINAFRKRRVQLDLSQEELSERMGIADRLWNKIEAKSHPKYREAAAQAHKAGLTQRQFSAFLGFEAQRVAAAAKGAPAKAAPAPSPTPATDTRPWKSLSFAEKLARGGHV